MAIDPLCRSPQTEFSNFTLQGEPPNRPPTQPPVRFQSTANTALEDHQRGSLDFLKGKITAIDALGRSPQTEFFTFPPNRRPFSDLPPHASTNSNHPSYRPARSPVWLPSAAPLAWSGCILKKIEGFRICSSSGSASVFCINKLSPVSGIKAGVRGCQRVHQCWPSYRPRR